MNAPLPGQENKKISLKSLTVSFLMGWVTWLILNGNIDSDTILSGVLVSLLITAFFTRKNLFENIRLSPKVFWTIFVWSLVFSIELVKSNIDVFIRILSPRLKINPAVVEVKTTLKTEIGRISLANAITLTPGTLTTEIRGDSLYIHWIDAKTTNVEEATQQIVRKFEKYLEVIFG